MKVINFTNGSISESQFDEVRINDFNKRRISACLHSLRNEHDTNRIDFLANSLAQFASEISRGDPNKAKVVITGFSPADVQLKIAKAMLLHGFDTYRTNITGEDVTWIDPR